MPDSSRTAYLFQCVGEDLYAVSYDATGRNIPRSPCTMGWRLCEEFQLGLRAPVPAPILPDPILKVSPTWATMCGAAGAAGQRKGRPPDNLVSLHVPWSFAAARAKGTARRLWSR